VELLRIERLTVAAADRTLLAEVDLTLTPGEFVALRGPSGSGKTTLLRSICGLIDASGGEVRFRGKVPDAIGWPTFRRGVVLVDQRPVLFDDTVRSNLARPFTYRAAHGARFSSDAGERLLERFGLNPRVMSQPARSLSQGEQQRVSLIRALLLDPPVLLLDEPTSALDEESISLVEQALVGEGRERGLAALVVTHDRRQAERLCDRTIELHRFIPAERGREGQ
jgi:putative ABC transport system ATP-binding protein